MQLGYGWAKYRDFFANASTSNRSGLTPRQGQPVIAETVAVRSTPLGRLAVHFKTGLAATLSGLLFFRCASRRTAAT